VLGEKENGPNRLQSVRPFFFVYAEGIEFLSFENKTWSDSSLSSPQPDMRLLQVLKEGCLIRLSVAGQIYNHHGSRDTLPFLCQ
jgi:hypothetical protein